MYWTPIYSPDRTPRIKNMRFTLWGIIRCSLVGQQRKKKNHICGTHTWEKLQKSLYPGVFEMWMDQRNRTKVEVVLDHLLQWWQAGKGLRLYENSKLNRGILQTKIVHTHIHDLPPKHIRINPWPTLRLSIALFPVVMASLYHPRSSAKSHRGPYPKLKPRALLTLRTLCETGSESQVGRYKDKSFYATFARVQRGRYRSMSVMNTRGRESIHFFL